jgi:hypothetical protein
MQSNNRHGPRANVSHGRLNRRVFMRGFPALTMKAELRVGPLSLAVALDEQDIHQGHRNSNFNCTPYGY